jgi:type II secretory pathway pseudopilin PulG
MARNGRAEAVPFQNLNSSEGICAGHRAVPVPISPLRRRRESGAMLLAVLFMVAMMVLAALAVAPSLVMQMKRDREEEMIHRGTEYARAIKKFYKKFGRYPANLEQLDNTNQIRFLRRRYKDPMTKDGEWKLLHYGDIATVIGAAGTGIPATQLAAQGGTAGGGLSSLPTTTPTAGTSSSDQGTTAAQAGAQSLAQQPSAGFGNQSPGFAQPGGGTSPLTAGTAGATGQSGFSLGPGQSSGPLGGQGQGDTGQGGNNNTIFGNTGVGGQTFGGGAIVGVASKSKDPTIRLFNQKKTYDEWQFIYSPMMDRVNVLLRGPYNGQTIGSTQIGTPAGQLNQGTAGQQPGGFGQQPGSFGQPNPQQNPQQNQQLTPGGQFPPDQSQP